MKAKFITKAGRVGYWILFLILAAAEVGSIYIALTDSIDEAPIFAVASVVWIIPAILCLRTAIFSVGAELTLERDRLTGRWRGREFSCPLSDVTMLYCLSSKKGGDYLYLCTKEGSYHFLGLTNAEAMRDRIAAEIPLPADCKNASDDLLQTKLQEKKRIAAKWNWLVLVVGLLLVVTGGGGLFALAKKLHLLIALSCIVVAVIAVIGLNRISGIAYWYNLLRNRVKKEITRRKIGSIDDYPKGYTDVVKVIYQEGYAFRVIVQRVEEGYICIDEYWDDELDPPAWVKDEDLDLDEEPMGGEEEDTPTFFKTLQEADEYLAEEWSCLDVDETVYFE